MPDPYRGYAPVTHDTNRIAEVITELNALSGGGATTSLSVDIGDGSATFQNISNGSATTIDFTSSSGATVRFNYGGGWNTGSGLYTAPATGIYVLNGWIRVGDSYSPSCNVGMGISLSNSTNSNVIMWHKYVTGGGIRATFGYHRMAFFTAGDSLRMYCYQDSGFMLPLVSAGMQLWQVG